MKAWAVASSIWGRDPGSPGGQPIIHVNIRQRITWADKITA